MKRILTIDIEGPGCMAVLESLSEDGNYTSLAQAGFTMQHGIHSWSRLLSEVHDQLKLDTLAPPEMPTESGVRYGDAFEVWQVVRCGSPAARGVGWGFMWPFDAEKQKVPTDTCCGFPSRAAAEMAMNSVRANYDRITGDLPIAVFRIFMLDGQYAFLDQQGQIHCTFPTRAEAQGCASKMEAAQEEERFQEEAPSEMLSQ